MLIFFIVFSAILIHIIESSGYNLELAENVATNPKLNVYCAYVNGELWDEQANISGIDLKDRYSGVISLYVLDSIGFVLMSESFIIMRPDPD